MLSTPRRLALALMTLALASPSPSMAMSGYKWKKRPLVVFAPDASHAKLAQQREIVASRRAGFAERHMVVIYVVGDQVSSELGGGPGLSASQLRARFGVGKGSFRALLVGKDGGVKLSAASPVTSGTLFATIDAMPMRRDEMRRRS